MVDFAAPAYKQVPAAAQLIADAESGKIVLHLPACCLTEARYPILSKNQPKAATVMRQFLKWGEAQGKIDGTQAVATRRVLDVFEQEVNQQLNNLDQALQGIHQLPGVEVFPLNEQMLRRSAELSLAGLDLKPFDLAILAAVLVRCDELRASGELDLNFCEQDSDLQPWDRNRNPKQTLVDLYNAAGVWVFRDFTLSYPPKPDTWPT